MKVIATHLPLKPGSHLFDKHKRKRKSKKRNVFHSLCLCLSHACACFISGNRREVSTSKLLIHRLEYFQISSDVIGLACVLFSCACFTCENVASFWLCLCLCLSHKWEPGLTVRNEMLVVVYKSLIIPLFGYFCVVWELGSTTTLTGLQPKVIGI